MPADLFEKRHHNTDREVVLMAVVAILAYCIAESADLSGAFAIFFCGITMSHYTWHSISPSARVMAVHNFRAIANVAEIFLFVYAGFDVIAKLSKHHATFSDSSLLREAAILAAVLFALVLVVRALFVATAVLLVNLWRSYTITLHESLVMWWGGLARGSITMALTYSYFYEPPHEALFADDAVLLAAVAMVVASSVLTGGLTATFLSAVEKHPHSRTSQMSTLGSHLATMNDDLTSVNSAAVRSLHLARTHSLLIPGAESAAAPGGQPVPK